MDEDEDDKSGWQRRGKEESERLLSRRTLEAERLKRTRPVGGAAPAPWPAASQSQPKPASWQPTNPCGSAHYATTYPPPSFSSGARGPSGPRSSRWASGVACMGPPLRAPASTIKQRMRIIETPLENCNL